MKTVEAQKHKYIVGYVRTASDGIVRLWVEAVLPSVKISGRDLCPASCACTCASLTELVPATTARISDAFLSVTHAFREARRRLTVSHYTLTDSH